MKIPEQAGKTRKQQNRPRLRTLDPFEGERHASWLELFFDLVYVLAVSQVAHILSDHPDFGGFLKYAALFVPIWWSWVGFTFYADRFESEETTYRVLTFAAMLAVTGFSLTLGNAFSSAGDAVFIVCYVLVRLVLILLYARSAYYIPLARTFAMQFIVGLGTSSLLLLISLFLAPPFRYALWAVALVLELVTPFLSLRAARLFPIDRSHIPERFGLFTIIVLGEAVVATAAGAARVEWNFSTVAAASLGFGMAACVWWINFDFVEDSAIKSRSLRTRFIYLYGHFFVVAAIVALGVGVQHAIKESVEAHLHFPTLALLAVGVAVYFAVITIIRFIADVCYLINVRLAIIAVSLSLLYLGQFLTPLAVLAILWLLFSGSVWLENLYSGEKAEEEEIPLLEACEHAPEMTVFRARSGDGCEECRKNNYKWVHLRLCLTCGHVGCCDTSVHKHATRHYHAKGHPVMASLEAGDNWAWCYADERFVPLPRKVLNKQDDTVE
ncbi:MAG TPA: low temperature requirement protein A [Pyrinomonadaceae bacterium]